MKNCALWVRAALSVVAGVGALSGCAPADETGTVSEALQQCATGTTLEGIDIYDGDGVINWTSAAGAGIRFAEIKATQGTYNTQTRWSSNRSNAQAAGIYTASYHFFDPTEDGVAQAHHFLSVIGTLNAHDLPAMLDIECPDGDANCLYSGAAGTGVSAATMRQRMLDWLTTVETATGRTPFIYTFGSYFSSNGIGTTGLEHYPLIIAYPTTSNCFNVPSPWTRAAIWQYSWTGTVAGVSGQVDRDKFLGDLSALQMLANGGADWGAQYVAQSWPLASAPPMTMHAGERMAGWIELRNIGRRAWDGNTRLATTGPRDRASAFAGSDWVMPDRPAQVTGTVAPGATFRFMFTWQAPATPGRYDEHFGVVEDGTGWFSDPGQGGPPDDQIEALIQVLPADDAGVVSDGGADAAANDGAVSGDAGVGDAGVGDAGASDGGRREDAAGDGGSEMGAAGCGCRAAGEGTARGASGAAAVVAAVVAAGLARRRGRGRA